MTNYKTISAKKIFSADFEIKKSKFISHAKHIETEEEAREFIQQIKKKFFDADFFLPQEIFYSRQKIIFHNHRNFFESLHLQNFCSLNCKRGGVRICANQSACAKFYSAEISCYHDANICQFIFLDCFQDRISGSSARFAVII